MTATFCSRTYSLTDLFEWMFLNTASRRFEGGRSPLCEQNSHNQCPQPVSTTSVRQAGSAGDHNLHVLHGLSSLPSKLFIELPLALALAYIYIYISISIYI